MDTPCMLRKKLQIMNKHGLHARAADKFVKTAMHYGSEIEVLCNGKQANGKSIMSIISLGAKKGSEIELIIKGNDETNALNGLQELIYAYFGENQ
ncbi:MAG: Phosphocarrier protein HPr [Legionellaceae bacterium]